MRGGPKRTESSKMTGAKLRFCRKVAAGGEMSHVQGQHLQSVTHTRGTSLADHHAALGSGEWLLSLPDLIASVLWERM